MKELIALTPKEVERLRVIEASVEKRITQKEAGERLGLGVRQIKRLVRAYRERGAAGLVSGHRCHPSNRRYSDDFREEVVSLVRERYRGFGPTMVCEKLLECHGHKLSVETVRKWMIEGDLWSAKRRRAKRVHPPRERRDQLGDMVQIDGSVHDWFEGRGGRCSLLVFIDDATSRLLALRFVKAESVDAYMDVLRDYLDEHGRPVSFYMDKHSVFRITRGEDEQGPTQFTRLLLTLDIEPIHANSPQAKGRVERVNRTLQDRLVKEMRLRGISDMEAANAFLPEYVDKHNEKFAKDPANPEDAHRPVLHNNGELDLMFRTHHERTISKNLTVRYNNRTYRIIKRGKGYRLRDKKVTVCEASDGSVVLVYKGKLLPSELLAPGEPCVPVHDGKSVRQAVEDAKARQSHRPGWKPAPDHPWNRMIGAAVNKAASKMRSLAGL